jgi:hypothetical protein
MASAAPPFKAPGHIRPRFLVRIPLLRAPLPGPVTAEVGGSSPRRPTTILISAKPAPVKLAGLVSRP